MRTNTNDMVRFVSKASKRASQLHVLLRAIEQLLPESATWREMTNTARSLELRIETMLAVIEEILDRDPETYVPLLLKLNDLQDMEHGPSNGQNQPSLDLREL